MFHRYFIKAFLHDWLFYIIGVPATTLGLYIKKVDIGNSTHIFYDDSLYLDKLFKE